MIVEAPMWLLIPTAALAWLLYAGVVLAERAENREVDRQAKQQQEDRKADQAEEDHGEHLGVLGSAGVHARSVAHDLTSLLAERERAGLRLPPGIPSVAERLDRWEEIR